MFNPFRRPAPAEDNGRLKDAVALVTGGTRGIGAATAQVFAAEGARVVIAGRSREDGEAVVRRIEAGGGAALYAEADVADASEVAALFRTVEERFGRLDIAFNNAGVMQPSARCEDIPEETWDDVMAVNVKGVWLCMRAEIEMMRATGGGAIVNMSSVWGVHPRERMSVYAASKHAVVGLSRTAALECVEDNIRVNVICPGLVETGMTRTVPPDRVRDGVPVGRMSTPEEIAAAVVWLCTDESAYFVGQALVIDGGLSIPRPPARAAAPRKLRKLSRRVRGA
jgi:NAD(P)-dependent dehydrogenase (short-subunit alcohol dehydrogenase family)